MVYRWITCIAGLGLAFVGLSTTAQERSKAPGTHMMIADPASLSGERSEAVYQSIRDTLRRQYMQSGESGNGCLSVVAPTQSRALPFRCPRSALREPLCKPFGTRLWSL